MKTCEDKPVFIAKCPLVYDRIDKEFTKLEKSVQQVLSELIEATVERTLVKYFRPSLCIYLFCFSLTPTEYPASNFWWVIGKMSCVTFSYFNVHGNFSSTVQFQFKSCLPIVDITNEQGNLSVAKQQQSLVNDLDQHLTVMRESLHPELIHQFLRVSLVAFTVPWFQLWF